MKLLIVIGLMFAASAGLSGKVLDGLYVGAGGGVLHVGGLDYEIPLAGTIYYNVPMPEGAPTWVERARAKSTVGASSGFIGYQFLRYFALEGRYTQFQALVVNIDYNPYIPEALYTVVSPEPRVIRAEYDMSTLSLALNARWPIRRGFSLEMGAGGERMRIEEEHGRGWKNGVEIDRVRLPNVSSNQWILSAGLDYRIWKGVSAKVSWTRHYYKNDKPLLFAAQDMRMDQYQLDLIYAF